MAKCAICKNKIETLFLEKILGTYIKKKGKKHVVCFECQKRFPHKEQLLEHL